MTFTDYLIDSLLVLLVVRQIRESRLDLVSLVLPFGVMAWVLHTYLHDIPTAGNDLVLIVGLALVGAVFGTISAATTRVRSDGSKYALVKAGWAAAGVWVLSMGGRFGFIFWATHGGGPQLFRFSQEHRLSASAWTAALVLMAFAEVLVRMGILFARSRRVTSPAAPAELVAA